MLITQIQPFDRSQNSELVDFTGKIYWVQAVDLNKFGKWSVQFYPESQSLEKIRDLQGRKGLRNLLKRNDNGDYLQISRPPQIEFSKGVFTPVTPPKIRDKDKNPFDGRIIGDGSDAIVTCEQYEFKIPNSERRAVALRLYGLTVLDLVPKAAPEVAPQEETAGWD